MTNRISVVIDVVQDRASQAINGFRTAVTNADGAVGKFKAGTTAAFDQVKANAGALAVAGGSALVAFAANAVSQFQDLALEAGKLSDSLGLPVEDISRLMEVAGDLGIETSELESTIGRMNRTAASTPGAFDAIGASIVRNKDGTTNVNETFLSVVDALHRIPDASTRAQAAQQIFGRSWQSIAELVGQGADEIRSSLEGVSDAQIIDDEEVAKARRFREAMDQLNDLFTQVSLTLGEHLIPMLADSAENLAGLVETADDLHLIEVATKFQEVTNQAGHFIRVVSTARGETDIFGRAVNNVNAEQWGFVQAAKEAGLSAEDIRRGLSMGVTSLEEYRAKQEESTAATNAAKIATEAAAVAHDEAAKKLDALDAQYEDAVKEIEDWAAGIESATTAGAESFGEFSVEADTSIGDLRQHLQDSAWDVAVWQENLISVAARTSPEFAAYLAEMGAAGAPMVAALSGNDAELQGTFDDWKAWSQVTGRDMVSAFDQVGPGVQEKIAAAGETIFGELRGQQYGAWLEAAGIGKQISSGIADGVTADAPKIRSAVQSAVSAASRGVQSTASSWWGGSAGAVVPGGAAHGRMVEVGEGNQAELFTSGGRTFLIPGNRGGRVIPATDTPPPGVTSTPPAQQMTIGAPTVNVSITLDGQELKGMVRTEIAEHDRELLGALNAGVRG